MRKKSKKEGTKELIDLIFGISFVVINALIVMLCYHNILLTTILLSILTVIWLAKWKSWRTFMLFLIGAVCGATIEIICIQFGVWRYTVTNFGNIPFWLFVLWGNAAALIYQGARKIKERRMKI